MKHSETISETNYRLRQLAIKTAKESNHKSFVYIAKGVAKTINL
jgi:hypothetical protein